jgi:hypothetical protein
MPCALYTRQCPNANKARPAATIVKSLRRASGNILNLNLVEAVVEQRGEFGKDHGIV